MLNLKFLILRYLSKLCASLAVKSSTASKKQAQKCQAKQIKVLGKACAATRTAMKVVESDTFDLEKARAEAIARVNIEYNKKIAGLQVSVDAAQEYADKQFEKLAKYKDEIRN